MIVLPIELEQQINRFAQIEQTNPVAIIKRMVDDYHAKRASVNDVVPTEGQRIMAILENTGLLGCMESGDENLSENYKEHLWGNE